MPDEEKAKKKNAASAPQPSPEETPAGEEAGPQAPPSPQTGEKEDPDEKESFSIVGLGTSAGGLDALQRFFEQVPPDSGLAYVVIVHLPPDHTSHLPEIIQKKAQIPVKAIEDGVEVQPNQVYVIVPDKDVELEKNRLYLVPSTAPRGRQAPIDYFFRSLAQARGDRAIGVILSGTGSNGTVGLRAIKEKAGMTMVQAPQTAAYDGMPQSAIDTGLVDYILPPAEMPAQLLAYVQTYRVRAGHRAVPLAGVSAKTFEKIFDILRDQTGHDFSGYKDATLRRRIDRRMTIQRMGNLADYLGFLQQNRAESQALYKELLIGVTNFFRDPEAFETLKEKVVPRLLAEKPDHRQLRLWVPGCSTGEEAYSLAIILQEYMMEQSHHVALKIFATDIDAQAIETARWGEYPDGIVVDVSPPRLGRFFTEQEDGTYRVNREIREMVVFAEQSVTRDPPFSRLDLISCRNLLIYLNGELQEQVLRLFHYSLRPDGFLFLGSSESRGQLEELFVPVDKKWKIFRRVGEQGASHPHPPLVGTDQYAPKAGPAPARGQPEADRSAFIEDAEQQLFQRMLLARHTPAAVVVDEEGRVLYLHGPTDRYLTLPSGAVPFDLVATAPQGLLPDLRTGLRRAIRQQERVVQEGLAVHKEDQPRWVKLTIEPIFERAGEARSWTGRLLVVFEPGEPPPPEEPVAPASDLDERDKQGLQQELRVTRQRLQATIEELELSNEDVRAANEELQAANEELQSINEELETSQEELQSVNEELATMNADYQTRIDSLTEAKSNLHNLLVSTRIATLFLDLDLKIRMYTPAVTEIINLIPSDEGRPAADLDTKLQYDHLLADAEEVLKTLVPQEREVQNSQGTWYNMRLSPYRTENNAIDGVVITFFEITSLKEREAQQYRLDYLEGMADTLTDPILLLDDQLHLLYANRAFYQLFDTTQAQARGQTLEGLAGGRLDHPDLRRSLSKVLTEDTTLEAFELAQRFPPLRGRRTLQLRARRLRYPVANTEMVLLVMKDVTERQQARLQAQKAEQRRREYVESIVATIPLPLLVLDPRLRVISTNRAFCHTFQITPQKTEGQYIYNLGEGQWNLPELRRLLEQIIPRDNVFEGFEVTHNFPHLGRQTMVLNARRLLQESGRPELILLAIEARGDSDEGGADGKGQK